ncbi:MAG: LysM peptidoglycan-binding domain-containing protein [Treponema sp.]|nr:LysM peptidoglycan-binding domain-containing protein [Treponema sp.]
MTRRLTAATVILLLFEAALFPGRLRAQEEYHYEYQPVSPDAAVPAVFSPTEWLPARGPVSPDGRPLRARMGATAPSAGVSSDVFSTGALSSAEMSSPLEILPFAKPEGGPYAGRGAGEPRIPGFDRALTRQYLERYSGGGGREWLTAVMKRAAPYLPFIREQIAARDLPPELLYLPVIESGFVSTARSKSGATGLWQFMRNSIAPFDIKINDWADERMDFWKSTEGALRKLEDNYRALGDWPLALAAYNAGLGGVQRAVRQAGRSDYWYLAEKKFIKTETIHYVPKLLAVAYILSNPRRFGLDLDWSADPCWERIPVGKQVDLEMLAAEAGVDGVALKAANRELFYGITPPDKNYYLKVRAADSSLISEALVRTDAVLVKHYFHTIRYGDTLSELAQHYGVSVAQITEANPGVQARYLRIGQQLRIPAYRDPGPYRYTHTAADDALRFTGNHLVKRGETLWSIALAYGVDPEALAEANGMSLNDTLREGRSLKTPGD